MSDPEVQSVDVLPALHPVGVEALVFRAPLQTPVETSFGRMLDRPACLLRVADRDGTQGWGEVWCNFPNVGAEHRARLATDCMAPLVLDRAWKSPVEAFVFLTKAMEVLALQTGEPGPIAQVIAGLDIALWDLAARKAGVPLWRLLGGRSPEVRVYASGLNPTAPERVAVQAAGRGHRAFKLKVGFGRERDLANLKALRKAVGGEALLMVDANQAWDAGEAAWMAKAMGDESLAWLEEPLRVDAPLAQWQELARISPVPLAAGENLRGDEQFDAFIGSGALRVIQPDIAKWGGFSAGVKLGARIDAAGAWFCPHWLGGGIGLAASMHLKAAVGGAGMVEIDANPNPLRDLFVAPYGSVRDGAVMLGDGIGLGVQPDLWGARSFLAMRQACGTVGVTYPEGGQ